MKTLKNICKKKYINNVGRGLNDETKPKIINSQRNLYYNALKIVKRKSLHTNIIIEIIMKT